MVADVFLSFFLVKANVFEGAVALCQSLCCLLNLWIIADSGAVMGISMTKEQAATHMNRLMLAACVGMMLRLIAVYLPSWSVVFLQSLSLVLEEMVSFFTAA